MYFSASVLGSGFAKFGLEAIRLLKVVIKPGVMAKTCIFVIEPTWAFKKRQRALERMRPRLHLSFGLFRAGLALSPGLRARV